MRQLSPLGEGSVSHMHALFCLSTKGSAFKPQDFAQKNLDSWLLMKKLRFGTLDQYSLMTTVGQGDMCPGVGQSPYSSPFFLHQVCFLSLSWLL